MAHSAAATGSSGSAEEDEIAIRRVVRGATERNRPARRTVGLKGGGLLSDGTTFEFSVLDLSYDGCRIEPEIALLPGVKFKMSVIGFRGFVDAEVRWYKGRQAGIEFIAEHSVERVRTPRKHDRRKLRGALSLRRVGRQHYEAQIFDLSPAGCKVEFVERPQAGELVWVRFDGIDSLEAIVRWVESFSGGLEFVRPMHPAIYDSVLSNLESGAAREDAEAQRPASLS